MKRQLSDIDGVESTERKDVLLRTNPHTMTRIHRIRNRTFKFRQRAQFQVFRRRIIAINSETTFFVDIGVTHGYYDGVDGDVHHDYVEELETYTQRGDGYDLLISSISSADLE
jgi:hypothetical protein